MKFNVAIVSTFLMLLLGCAESKTDTATPAKTTGAAKSTESTPGLGAPAPVDKKPTENKPAESTVATPEKPVAAGPKAVAVTDGGAELNPENSRIQFIGTHVGDKPDPRLGGFTKFSGKVAVDKTAVTAVSFEIATDSMWTEFDKLTAHLKGPDFFDTKEFPEIKFQSTSVEAVPGGKITVTGDLTLHGETKSILVPAIVTVTDDGVTLVAEFTIDRTEFGISYEPGKVDKTVSLTVVVGEKTAPKASAGG